MQRVFLSPQSKRPGASVFPGNTTASMNPVSKSAGTLKTVRSQSQFGPLQIKAVFILFLSVVKLLVMTGSPTDNLCQSFSLSGNGCDLNSFKGKERGKKRKEKMKENTHNPHIFPVLLMDKLTESLTSVSQGPHHNYRLGRRAVFRVIRDCLCFCPFGNKRGGIFRNLRPNIFHKGILLNRLLNNLKDGHFIIKTFF